MHSKSNDDCFVEVKVGRKQLIRKAGYRVGAVGCSGDGMREGMEHR